MTRRRLIAAAWISGATVPLLLGTVFVFGCCVLPFHQVAHELMPICDLTMRLAAGQDEPDAVPPSRGQEEPVKRLATVVPHAFRLAALSAETRAVPPRPATSYRSFITLGAVRCDRDVGLHVLVATFLI